MQLHLIKYIIPCILIFFASCKKEVVDWDLQQIETVPLVIESIITNDNKPFEVMLSKSIMELGDSPERVSGALVTISKIDNGVLVKRISLTELPFKKGTYHAVDTMSVSSDYEYHLKVTYNNIVYDAQTRPVEANHKLLFEYLLFDSIQNLYMLRGNYSTIYPAMWNITYTWDTLHTCDECRAQEFIYDLKTNDIQEQSKHDTILFPPRTKIVARMYTLPPDYVRYLRSLLMETEWNGSLYDQEQTNVLGNISNGASGFFAACMVQSDSLIVNDLVRGRNFRGLFWN